MMQKSGVWMRAAFGSALAISAVTLVLQGADNKGIRLVLAVILRHRAVLKTA